MMDGRTGRDEAIACYEQSKIEHVKCQLSVTDERRTVHSGNQAVQYRHSAVTVNHSRLAGRPACPVSVLWAYAALLQQLL